MDKYERACVAYVQASQEVRRLTKKIGLLITVCREHKAKEVGEVPEYCMIDCCLPEYYSSVAKNSNCNPFNKGPIGLDCEFCMEADELIQHRKKARKSLGAAKRQITMLGRKAIAKAEG